MSMAINRISASGVAGMLYPVMKPNRVAKVGGDGRSSASTNTTKGTSSPQPTDATNTAEQVRAGFEFARMALDGMATTGTAPPNSDQVQAGVVQQASSGYTQAEQQPGQSLDIVA